MIEIQNTIGNVSSLPVLLQSLLIGVIFGYILYLMIRKTSKLVGDNSGYMVILPILIPVMILIISIIKSSLALSLGLVGALSIVRFRTPIKEAEELVYLFFAIAIGLGLGAGEILLTSVTFIFIVSIMFVVSRFRKVDKLDNVYLDIFHHSSDLKLEEVSKILKNNNISYQVKRVDNGQKESSITYAMNLSNVDSLERLLKEIKGLDKTIQINLINNMF